MGACCSICAPAGSETANDREIRTKFDTDQRVDKKEKKLLLLGTGASGKSTIFKNLKKVNGEEIADERTLHETLSSMRSNCVQGMYTILLKAQDMVHKWGFADCQLPDGDHEMNAAAKTIVDWFSEAFSDDTQMPDDILVEIGSALAVLWSRDVVKKVFQRRGGRFFMEENMEFFFDKAETIFAPDYLATEEDVIKSRVRTTGVVTYVYTTQRTTFKITDVGGQHNERKKWIHQFDNVSAVIYVAALNHFDLVLFENENMNAMHESIQVWTEMANNSAFETSELILFLNKEDLFRDMLGEGKTLSLCFSKEKNWQGPEFWDGPNYERKKDQAEDDAHFEECYEQALYFVQDVYLARNEQPRVIFTHVTCATHSDGIEKVFWDVQNIVIRANLRRGGLLMDSESNQPREQPRPKNLQKGKGEVTAAPNDYQ